MKFRSREINVFGISALDLFASALGAFILMSIVLMPYFLSEKSREIERTRLALEQSRAAEAASQKKLARSRAAQAETRRSLAQAREAEAEARKHLARSRAAEAEARKSLARAKASDEAARSRLAQSQAAAAEARKSLVQSRAAEAEARKSLAQSRAAETEARERVAQAQRAREQCRQQAAVCRRELGGLRGAATGLQSCRAELQACAKKLSKTFLAIVVNWPTDKHDVDLHVIDAANEEFSFNRATVPGRRGRLSTDTEEGPGVEVWEVSDAPIGSYRVLYNLYKRHGNPADAVVEGGVYHRDGYHRFPQRRLSQEGRRHAVLVAILKVMNDGSVEISVP